MSVGFRSDERSLAFATFARHLGIWDLSYYDRHSVGNLELRLGRLPASSLNAGYIHRLRAWAARVRAGSER